jgi:hypothetical protein
VAIKPFGSQNRLRKRSEHTADNERLSKRKTLVSPAVQ